MKLLGAALLLMGSAWAQENFTFGSDNSDFISTARELIKAVDSPSTETENILRKVTITIDGERVTKRTQSIWFYPSSADVDNYGTESIAYNPLNESVKVLTAAAISPQGRVTRFNPDEVQFGEGDQYNTFDDTKVAYLAIPGLQAKGYVALDIVRETDFSLKETAYSASQWTASSFAIRDLNVEIQWSDERPIWHIADPNLECVESTRSLNCQRKNVDPVTLDESAYAHDHFVGIRVAPSQSWKTVVSRMNKAYENAFTQQELLNDLHSSLVKPSMSEAEQIDALYRFASDQVRYVSMSTEGHTHTPHGNDDVIRNRYGDCKDKTALLDALLKKSNIKATPWLVATDRTDSDTLVLPSLGYFNHVVLCLDDVTPAICLDPTDTSTHWQTTASWIQGKVALPLTKDAVPTTVPAAKFRWQLDVSTELTFDDAGGLTEQLTKTFKGEYASAMRDYLQPNADDQAEQLNERYRDVVANPATLTSSVESGMSPESHVLITVTNATYETILAPGQDMMYSEIDAWLNDELRTSHLQNERQALSFAGTKLASHYWVSVPQQWRLSKPTATFDISTEFGRLWRESGVQGNGMWTRTNLEIPRQTITPEQREKFNETLNLFSSVLDVRVDAPLR